MSEVEVFQFPETGSEIRTVVLDDGTPCLVAADLCGALGLQNARRTVERIDPDEVRQAYVIDSMGRQQLAYVVTEAGMYELVLRSDKPEARRFRKWVTSDVLPAIARTGQYVGMGDRMPTHPESLRGWARQIELTEAERRRAEIAETKVYKLEPVAAQAEHFREADGLIAVAQFANEIALWARENHGVKVLHEQIRDFLGELGLVIRSKSIRRNEPTAEALKRGFMRSKHTAVERSTGPQQKISARFTPAGYGYAWDRAVRRIAEHGSLDKPKSVERQSA